MISARPVATTKPQPAPNHTPRNQSVLSIQAPRNRTPDIFQPRFQGNKTQPEKKPGWFSQALHSPYTKIAAGGLLLAGGFGIKLLGLATALGAPILLPIGLGVAAIGLGFVGWGVYQAFSNKKNTSTADESCSQESSATKADGTSNTPPSDGSDITADISTVSGEGAPVTSGGKRGSSSGNESRETLSDNSKRTSQASFHTDSQQHEAQTAATGKTTNKVKPNAHKHVSFAPLPDRNQSTKAKQPVNKSTSPKQAPETNARISRNTATTKTSDERKASSTNHLTQLGRSFARWKRSVANYVTEGLGMDPVSRTRSQARLAREATYSCRSSGHVTETRFNNQSHYY